MRCDECNAEILPDDIFCDGHDIYYKCPKCKVEVVFDREE